MSIYRPTQIIAIFKLVFIVFQATWFLREDTTSYNYITVYYVPYEILYYVHHGLW
jgi:hypothetical protein